MNKTFEKILKKTKEKCKQSYITNHGKDYTEFDICTELSLCFNEVQRIVQEVAEEYNNGWIPCGERLPSGLDFVLFTDKDGEVDICSIEYFYDYLDRFTAWQPLPEPYQPK